MASQVQDAGVGLLSPRLRQLVEQQVADARAVTLRAIEAMRESIPEYRNLDDPATQEDIYGSVFFNVGLWHQALLKGEPLSPAQLEPVIAFSRHRVHQGVNLQSLLQAFRTGSRVLWSVLLEQAGDDQELHRELLFKVSPYILYHFDLLCQTVGQAHALEQQQKARWRDRLRHELCGVIFSHPDDLQGFREHALSLGLDSGAPHLALALRLANVPADLLTHDTGLDQVIAAVARILGIEREGLLRTPRHGHVLLWVPLANGEAVPDAERKLAQQAELMVKAGQGITAVGLGLPDSGPRGWRRSADQALKALEIGIRVEPARAVHRYIDFAFDDVLTYSENVVRFFEALIERLAIEPHLLKTLQAFFEHRQHRKAVAAALNIHPNTLSYRLERIENILGAQLDDMGWQLRLYAGLRLRQIGAQT